MRRITYLFSVFLLGAAGVLSSCSDTKTYAELLADEKQAIKDFVKFDGIVPISVSEDGLESYVNDELDWSPNTKHFEVGKWYKFEDGLYMKIKSYGDTTQMFASSSMGYPSITMRYDSCYNLLTFEDWNSPYTNNLDPYSLWTISSWNKNSSGSTFGSGLEFPIQFLGVDGSVSLILPSKIGLTSEISSVIPYYFGDIKYKESYQ
jgi:hypothetical protein